MIAYTHDEHLCAQDLCSIGLQYICFSVLSPPPASVFTGESEFEEGNVTLYSNPPELPDVMKAQEGSGASSGLTAD